MAIIINDNYSLAAQKPFDARYLNISTPWTSIAAVNAGIPTYRYLGLTVNINGVEYWYKNGVTDTDLIIKGGGEATSGERVTKRINLTSHGFSLNNVIGWSGGTYNKAIANGSYDGEVLGIVNNVIDNDNFDLTQTGYVSGLTGLSINKTYFLSDTIKGGLTINPPTTSGHILKPILIANSPTSAWIFSYPGYSVSTGSTGSGGTINIITGGTGINVLTTGTTTIISIDGSNLIGNSLMWSGNTFNVDINSGTLSDALNNKLNISDFEVYTGTTLPNTYYNKTQIDAIITGITSNCVNVMVTTTPTYIATVNDDYIGTTGGTIIYLPPIPKIGQRIIVADVIGNSSILHIIISGNGKLINGNGYATINTDFGSITFIYTGSFWSVTAFIN